MTPLERLIAANEAYHNAVKRILKLDVDINNKVEFACKAHYIFVRMADIEEFVKSKMSPLEL